MRSAITARHTEITPELRERVERLVPRLARHARRPQGVEVIFDADHGQKSVELIVTIPRQPPVVARGEASDFATALDRAAERVKHQLDGLAGKSEARRRRA